MYCAKGSADELPPIRVVTGVPGSGKTTEVRKRMVGQKGLYLFVMPRIDLINERLEDIETDAKLAGTHPILDFVHSKDGKTGPIESKVRRAVDSYKSHDHVILLMTHDAMTACAPEVFAGWHVFIDEVPLTVAGGSFSAPASAIFLRQAYDLDPLDAHWAELVPKPNAPSASDILRDRHLSGLAEMNKWTSRTGAFINVVSWDQAEGSDRTLQWFAMWSFGRLRKAQSITVIGSGWDESLTYKAQKACYKEKFSFEFEEIKRQSSKLPHVRIHYFCNQSFSSRQLIRQHRTILVPIAQWMSTVSLGFWSANKDTAPFLAASLKGEHVSPRQEGSNSLSNHTSCCFIYSAKETPNDQALGELIGITKREIWEARECEDIKQFVCRGALRNADFEGVYDCYLLSKEQAEMLADYLTAKGMSTIELVPEYSAGVMNEVPVPRAYSKSTKDETSKAEQTDRRRVKNCEAKRRQRAREKENAIANGTARPVGRPPKKRMDAPKKMPALEAA